MRVKLGIKSVISGCIFLLLFSTHEISAQTFSWASYSNASNRPLGGNYYTQTITTGTNSTTVYADIQSFGNASGAIDNTIFKSSSPLYVTSDAVGGCGTNNGFQSGLGIYCDWADYGTAASNATTQWPYVLVTVDFTGGTNGVCGPVTFSIYDINSDGSTQTFLDWVEVYAYDKTGTYIQPSISSATYKCNYNMGTYSNPAGGPLKYNGSSSCSCWPDYITVGAAGTVVGKILIKYYPDHSGSYWNTSPRNPRSQYIVISNISTGGVSCAAIVLPVELTSFNGRCVNGKKQFTWTTASEKNNHHFVLQQSKDGQTYSDIAIVAGNGTTQLTHHYETEIPETEDAMYYRLKQVDRNGQENLSDMIFVSCSEGSWGKAMLYPNPTNDKCTISFASQAEAEVQVTIMDVTGQQLLSKSYPVVKGNNDLSIESDGLTAGVYYITLTDPQNLMNRRSLKLVKN